MGAELIHDIKGLNAEVKRVQIFPYTNEDIPTILKRAPGHSYDGVKCMTCKYYINVRGKEKNIIIMCPACKEATPIRKPPGDKMFVRCICNCLLVCKTSARTIMCPRPNCATLIDIAQKTGRSAAISDPANIVFISCAFCHHIFQYDVFTKKLALCPYCSKKSAVRKEFVRRRTIPLFTLAVCFLVAGITIPAATFGIVTSFPGIIAVYVGLFLVSIILFLAAVFFDTIRVSQVVQSNTYDE